MAFINKHQIWGKQIRKIPHFDRSMSSPKGKSFPFPPFLPYGLQETQQRDDTCHLCSLRQCCTFGHKEPPVVPVTKRQAFHLKSSPFLLAPWGFSCTGWGHGDPNLRHGEETELACGRSSVLTEEEALWIEGDNTSEVRLSYSSYLLLGNLPPSPAT